MVWLRYLACRLLGHRHDGSFRYYQPPEGRRVAQWPNLRGPARVLPICRRCRAEIELERPAVSNPETKTLTGEAVIDRRPQEERSR